jgi:hypothetical protein
VVLKFGYYKAARSPLNSHTNTGAYAYSPHSTSPYLKEWVRGLVDLLSRAAKKQLYTFLRLSMKKV